ncbi:right-handed parallel beta-helix repeat-containing protein [Enterococcus lactis]|uniref:right-handed parallel beta-helix repeat-containing protein n=1 Tax=Enterococcus lactis TaxID=357441 RepID=UPI0022E622CE|nr:right-handed parallel beta-helix repeat-containing protein [Enterococcus lactis]
MVYKTNESIIVIQAEATSPNRTNVVFWSHDRGTAKLRMKLVRKNGIPQSLPEGTTVPIRLMFRSTTAEGGYGKHDYLATIEDPVNGIVSIVLEDNILGYVGTVEGSVYIDFPNDRSLDTAGRFTFYIKRSPIDDSTPELEDYYFNGFSQTIDKIEKILADGKQEIEQKIAESETQIDAKLKDTNDKITKASQDVATLNTNIDKANDRIDQTNQQIDEVLSGANKFRTDIDTLKNSKADKTFVDAQLAQTAQDLEQRGVNIEQFGAKGDNSTTNTQAIQSAVDFLNGLGGGTLVVPDGIFLIDGLINIPSNIQITGITRAKSKIKTTNQNAHIFRINDNAVNIRIYDLSFEGTGIVSASGTPSYGVYGRGTTGVTIERCSFEYLGGGGIYLLSNTKRVRIYDCYLNNNPYASQENFDIQIYDRAEDVRIINNECLSDNDMGIGVFFRDLTNVWVENNKCHNHQRHGIIVGYHSGTPIGINIRDNRCHNNGWVGIYTAFDPSTVLDGKTVITNNQCRGNGYNASPVGSPDESIRGGIVFSGFNALIEGNHSYNNLGSFGSGIRSRGTDLSILNNFCLDNEGDGIIMWATVSSIKNNNLIQGNSCLRNAGDGIRAAGGSNSISVENINIISNKCNKNGARGISAIYCPSGSITSNECLENGYNGIYSIHNTFKLMIHNNKLLNNCKDESRTTYLAGLCLGGGSGVSVQSNIISQDSGERQTHGIWALSGQAKAVIIGNVIDGVSTGIQDASGTALRANNAINGVLGG